MNTVPIVINVPGDVARVALLNGDPRYLSSLGAGFHILGLVVDALRSPEAVAGQTALELADLAERRRIENLAVNALARAELVDRLDDADHLAQATKAAELRSTYRRDRIHHAAALELCQALDHARNLRACAACRTAIDRAERSSHAFLYADRTDEAATR